MESKKALEAARSPAKESTESVEQPSTVDEKTECADDKTEKAPNRGTACECILSCDWFCL